LCSSTNDYCTSQKRDISENWTPEDVIDIEIDHATPEYTQYSLKNRFEVYENAKNKNIVADFYRFPSRTLEEE
jgi:hypothetical protein